MHHLLPKSRCEEFGIKGKDKSDKRNKKSILAKKHDAWHALFVNMTPEEALMRAAELYDFLEYEIGKISDSDIRRFYIEIRRRVRNNDECNYYYTENRRKAWGILFVESNSKKYVSSFERFVKHIIMSFFPKIYINSKEPPFYENKITDPLVRTLFCVMGAE